MRRCFGPGSFPTGEDGPSSAAAAGRATSFQRKVEREIETWLDDMDPLVSCLMVTKPGRFDLMAHSVQDFVRQTYASRELVIVSSASTAPERQRLNAYLEALDRPDIRLAFVPEATTLGAARNTSVAAARGDFVCQWDDDDRHHPGRIEAQVRALLQDRKQACYLQDVFHLLAEEHALYWGHWGGTAGGVHPGTLLAARAAPVAYPETGAESVVGEDSVVLRQLWARGGFAVVAKQPHLFVYVSHGGNSWSADRHRFLARGLAASRRELLDNENGIRWGLQPFGLAAETIVNGVDGAAFMLGSRVGPSPEKPAVPDATARHGPNRRDHMPTVLLAQEFGGNFGHVRRLLTIARALGPARYVVAVPHGPVVRPVVVQALGPDVEMFGDMVFRAPLLAQIASTGDSTVADVFHNIGYAHLPSLTRAAERWRAVIDRVAPDLIICEFAPTLRLASWDRIPTVVMGGSYETPPREGRLPTVVPFGHDPGPASLDREGSLLAAAQAVRRQLGGPPLRFFGDLFQGERVFCMAPPGCDPYAGQRQGPIYHPFPPPAILRPLPPYAERTGPDVFCFLWSDHPWLDLIVTALNGLPRRSEIHIRGVDPQRLATQCAPQVGVRPASADFATLLPQARVFLHYGGAAACYAGLLAATVQVIIPIHLEQEMTARGMIANGGTIGLALDKAATPERLRAIIAAALDDTGLQAAALVASEQAWATRPPDAVPEIVAACRDLMARPRPVPQTAHRRSPSPHTGRSDAAGG